MRYRGKGIYCDEENACDHEDPLTPHLPIQSVKAEVTVYLNVRHYNIRFEIIRGC